MTSDQETAATLKSKVLFKQSRFYMTAFLLKSSCKHVVVQTYYAKTHVIKP